MDQEQGEILKNQLPGLPQVSYRLRTFDEWLSVKGIPTPPTKGFETSPITLENQITFLLNVVKMLNFGVNDKGFVKTPDNQKDLFVKRDDVYYDDKEDTYFLKEDRINENSK